MIPGEILPAVGEIVLNKDRAAISLSVANTGDRPIQVGSHYHFAETNGALAFDRKAALGYRLNGDKRRLWWRVLPQVQDLQLKPGRRGTRHDALGHKPAAVAHIDALARADSPHGRRVPALVPVEQHARADGRSGHRVGQEDRQRHVSPLSLLEGVPDAADRGIDRVSPEDAATAQGEAGPAGAGSDSGTMVNLEEPARTRL